MPYAILDVQIKFIKKKSPLKKDDISMINVNPVTVKDLLSILDPSKAYSHDGISPKILKYTVKFIPKPLANFYNYFLRTTIYHDTWKFAYVIIYITPLLKKVTKN